MSKLLFAYIQEYDTAEELRGISPLATLFKDQSTFLCCDVKLLCREVYCLSLEKSFVTLMRYSLVIYLYSLHAIMAFSILSKNHWIL